MNRLAVSAASITLVFLVACPSNEDPQRRLESPSAVPATPTVEVLEPEPSPVVTKPDYCEPAGTDELHEVLSTPASPYFVHHPTSGSPAGPTVMFLPGGSGSRRGAERVWRNFLSEGDESGVFRLVMLYSEDGELSDAVPRMYKIREEVLACFGGDSNKVHIAGTSNGGHMAFFMMLTRPQMFASLLGAPGEFPVNQPERWVTSLGGRPVFNGVGANDVDWIPGVRGTHDGLVSSGGNSVNVEFVGQGHQVGPEFDERIFFEFWANN